MSVRPGGIGSQQRWPLGGVDKFEPVSGGGEMDHAERRFYFENPSKIVGKTITYKSFRQGVKVLPRFPTFKHIRSSEDMDSI